MKYPPFVVNKECKPKSILNGMKASFHNIEVNFVYDCLKEHEKLDSIYLLKSSNQNHKTVLTTAKRPRHPNRINIVKYIKCSSLSLKGTFLSLVMNDG